VFWKDPNVLTISIHQAGCFPQDQGWVDEIGEFSNINIPLSPGSGFGAYREAMDGVMRRRFAERAMLLAKQALTQPIDMAEVLRRGPNSKLEALRVEIYDRVNALGIGAQGLGGLTTVLDVKVATIRPTPPPCLWV
jgi:hypothetical protein